MFFFFFYMCVCLYHVCYFISIDLYEYYDDATGFCFKFSISPSFELTILRQYESCSLTFFSKFVRTLSCKRKWELVEWMKNAGHYFNFSVLFLTHWSLTVSATIVLYSSTVLFNLAFCNINSSVICLAPSSLPSAVPFDLLMLLRLFSFVWCCCCSR